MNNLKRVSAAVLAGMALLSASGVAHGMGFGHANSHAILGDTLRVSVPLRLEAGEEISRECLAADVYFGEDKVAPKVINLDLLPGDSAAERMVVVSSTIAISEPVVTIYLAAGCMSRVTRKIVTFPDPPTLVAQPLTAPVSVADRIDTASLPPATPVSPPGALATRPLTSQSQADRHAARATASAKRDAGHSSSSLPSMMVADVAGSMEAAKARPAAKASERSSAKTTHVRKDVASAKLDTRANAKADGGRLLLDPVDADAMVIPDLRMTPTLGVSAAAADDASPEVKARRDAAAALWLALNASPEQMARDRDRLQQLEQRLGQLQKEGEAARQQVQGLQARVQAAESHAAGKWVYVLALLTIAASAVAAFLYMRLRRVQGANWWQSSDESSLSDQESGLESEGHTSTEFVHVPDTGPGAYPATTTQAVYPMSSAPSAPLTSAEAHRPMATAALHQMVPDAVPPALQQVPSGLFASPQTESLREVSVEELIDLEQQAEFFVVLGQDDAAIDLLESHVLHTTGASPLPFLKLLEIYRRLGKRADYERVQAEFNRRFNAYAPSWDADLQQGHTLVDYPGVIERLQALWPSPAEAMVVLEKSLTRPESGDDTFELPAYRELLFLYAVARDLSERNVGERQSVDLLLPVIDISGAEPSVSVAQSGSPVIEPLMATRPIKAHPEARPSIELDLQLDDLPNVDPDHKP